MYIECPVSQEHIRNVKTNKQSWCLALWCLWYIEPLEVGFLVWLHIRILWGVGFEKIYGIL